MDIYFWTSNFLDSASGVWKMRWPKSMHFRLSRQKNSIGRAYFSIVELLVVGTVLGVITALIFPSINKTMEAAKVNACFSNMRSIGYFMNVYSQDYERYVLFRKSKSTETNQTTGHTVFWDDMLGEGYDGRNLSVETQDRGTLRYSRNELMGAEVYNCPNDKIGNLRDFDTGLSWYEKMQPDALGRSYSINGYRSWVNAKSDDKQGFSGAAHGSMVAKNKFLPWSQIPARVINPSKVFLVVERPGAGWIGGGGGALSGSTKSQIGIPDINWWQTNRGITVTFDNILYHYGGWNYLFADGHVQNMLPEDTIGPTGSEGNPKGLWSIKVTD